MSAPIKVPKGLYGVAVTETRIAKSDADGSLIYRGYPIADLAAHATFEEAAWLIIKGTLPTRGELDEFISSIGSRMEVSAKVYAVMRDLGRDSHPIDVLRTGISALGSVDSEPTVALQQASIEAKMSVLAANCHRVPRGSGPRGPKPAARFGANLLQMLTDREASEYEEWVFERVLMMYLEHDLNASSFTVRVVASTRADPYAAAAAGLAALKGPLHGGANEAAMDMLLEVRGPDNASAYVMSALKDGKKVMGFGHRVYKKLDPRAQLCKGYLRELLKKQGTDDSLYRLCDALENEMWERKKLPANLDFYAAPLMYSLGIEIPLYTPVFAASRVFGWMAHYDEQVAEDRLIRPDATYVGPTGLKYSPPGSG